MLGFLCGPNGDAFTLGSVELRLKYRGILAFQCCGSEVVISAPARDCYGLCRVREAPARLIPERPLGLARPEPRFWAEKLLAG